MDNMFSPGLWRAIEKYGDLLENFDEGKNFGNFVDKVHELGIEIRVYDQYRLIFLLTYLKYGANGFYLEANYYSGTETYRYRFGVLKYEDKKLEILSTPLWRVGPQEIGTLTEKLVVEFNEVDNFYSSDLARKIIKEVVELYKNKI